eukprot:scpid61987/ scgid21611/ Putative uncharacterized protein CXorf58
MDASEPGQGRQDHVLSQERYDAGCIIWEAWCRYRDRKWYLILRIAIQEAEHSLSHSVLRQLIPTEAKLLRDKVMKAKVRFRLIGGTFPPGIVFKIYVTSGEQTAVQYLSGKELIRPASEAAQDALKQMGKRKFHDQMAEDEMYEDAIGVNSLADAVTPQECMRYQSLRDEQHAGEGGKSNSWRRLSLDVFLRTITGQPVYRPRGPSIPVILGRKHISASGKPVTAAAKPRSLLERPGGGTGESAAVLAQRNTTGVTSAPAAPARKPRVPLSQLSKQKRLEKMRQLYGLAEKSPGNIIAQMQQVEAGCAVDSAQLQTNDGDKVAGAGETVDCEADELYTWSQDLCLDDPDLDF